MNDSAEKRREAARERQRRSRARRALACPEEVLARKQLKAAREYERRLNETSIELEIRKRKGRERYIQRLKAESAEQAQKRRQRNAELAARRRANESTEEKNRRKRIDRERHTQKRNGNGIEALNRGGRQQLSSGLCRVCGLSMYETVQCKQEREDFTVGPPLSPHPAEDEPRQLCSCKELSADNAQGLPTVFNTVILNEAAAPSNGEERLEFAQDDPLSLETETLVAMREGPGVGQTSSVRVSICPADDVLSGEEEMFRECVVKEEFDEETKPPVDPLQDTEPSVCDEGFLHCSLKGSLPVSNADGGPLPVLLEYIKDEDIDIEEPHTSDTEGAQPVTAAAADSTDHPISTSSGSPTNSKCSHNCSSCGKSFPNLQHLRQHEQTMHSDKLPHNCTCCDQQFASRASLRAHKRKVLELMKPHRCELCGRRFVDAEQLQEHTHTHSKDQPHQCGLCGVYFCRVKQLRSHRCQHFTGTGASAEGEVSDPKHSHVCASCGKSFRGLKGLRQHERTIHSDTLPHNCNCCDQQFASRASLRVHKREVLELVKPHPCKLCGRRFADAEQLQVHSKEPHQCAECGVWFANVEHLWSHGCRYPTGLRGSFERKHTLAVRSADEARLPVLLENVKEEPEDESEDIDVEEPHSPDADSAQLTAAASAESSAADATDRPTPSTGSGILHKSVSTHTVSTSECSYKCEYCDKQFRENRYLRAHKRTVHKRTKPHRCDLCGLEFARLGRLRVHTLTHSKKRHTCVLCGVYFFCVKQLQLHRCQHVTGTGASADGETPQAGSEVTVLETKAPLQPENVKKEVMDIEETEQSDTEGSGQCVTDDPCHSDSKRETDLTTDSYACAACSERFPLQSALHSHMTNRHLKRFPCSVCSKVFNSSQGLGRHLRVHRESLLYRCDVCAKKFCSESALERHTLYQHVSSQGYVCPECGVACPSFKELASHCKLDCTKDAVSPSTPEESHASSPALAPCPSCPLSFATPHALQTHAVQHLSDSDALTCYSCNQTCPSKAQLLEHLSLHRPRSDAVVGTSPVVLGQNRRGETKCHICDKVLSSVASLKCHLQIHEGTFSHHCDICGKQCRGIGNLRQHMSYVHSSSRNHICQKCGEAFRYKRELNNHFLMHRSDTVHRCEQCGKLFEVARNLRTHIRDVHSEKTPVRCEICGKMFKLKSHLRPHLLRHRQDRSFKCSVCGEAFRTKEVCRMHERRHATKWRLRCLSCHMDFPSEEGLTRHREKVHS